MNETSSFFTQYLNETVDKAGTPFSTLKWLKHLDNDSLEMLCGYIDNFDERTPMEDVDENEAKDMFHLVHQLIILETDKKEWESDYPDEISALQALSGLIVMEGMRRKGIIEITGDGLITKKNTFSKLTKFGSEVQKGLKAKSH